MEVSRLPGPNQSAHFSLLFEGYLCTHLPSSTPLLTTLPAKPPPPLLLAAALHNQLHRHQQRPLIMIPLSSTPSITPPTSTPWTPIPPTPSNSPTSPPAHPAMPEAARVPATPRGACASAHMNVRRLRGRGRGQAAG